MLLNDNSVYVSGYLFRGLGVGPQGALLLRF
jgi:hypothetical protein